MAQLTARVMLASLLLILSASVAAGSSLQVSVRVVVLSPTFFVGNPPFSAPFSISCGGTGTVSVSLAGSSLEIETSVEDVPVGCDVPTLSVRVFAETLEVPDLGYGITPISVSHSANRASGTLALDACSLMLPTEYNSHLLAQTVILANRRNAALEHISNPTEAIVLSLLSGDVARDMEWDISCFYSDDGGDFVDTVTLDFFVPPTGPLASVPSLGHIGRSGLVAALLAVLVGAARRSTGTERR